MLNQLLKHKKIIIILMIGGILYSAAMVLTYVFFLSPKNQGLVPQTQQTNVGIRPKPTREELQSVMLFDEKRIFNLRPNEKDSFKVLQIENIEMQCFIAVPGIKNPIEEINSYKNELRELVSVYFQGVDSNDIMTPEGRNIITKDILIRMNELLKTNEETGSDLIYNLIIENWVYG